MGALQNLDSKIDSLTAYEATMEKLKMHRQWLAVQEQGKVISAKSKEAAMLVVIACMGQIHAFPDTCEHGTATAVTDACKLAECLKVRKETLPSIVRTSMEALKKKKKVEDEAAVKVPAPAASTTEGTGGMDVQEEAVVGEAEDEGEDAGPAKGGHTKAKGRGRGKSPTPKAKVKAKAKATAVEKVVKAPGSKKPNPKNK